MKSLIPFFGVFFAFLPLHAENSMDVRMGIKEIFGHQERTKAKLVLAPLPKDSPATLSLILSILRFNLNLSGQVETSDAVSLQEAKASPNPRLELSLTETEQGLLLHAEVLAGASPLGSANIQGQKANIRRMAHKLSQETLRTLTGEKGFFMSKIAFTLKYKKRKEIWIADWDGKNAEPLTNWGTISTLPAFNPDGKSLVFTSYKDGNPDLYRYDFTKRIFQQISIQQGINASATFDPKNPQIALSLSRGKDPNLYILSLEGKILRQITQTNGIDTSPTFSPNGQEIAFTTDRSGNPQIFLMNKDGGNVRRLTYGLFWADSPDWAPDGSAIAFSGKHMRDEKFQIFVADPLGLKIFKLTTEGAHEHPSFSPDSRFLAYAAKREGKWELYIKGLADMAGDLRILSFTGASALEPSWSPLIED